MGGHDRRRQLGSIAARLAVPTIAVVAFLSGTPAPAAGSAPTPVPRPRPQVTTAPAPAPAPADTPACLAAQQALAAGEIDFAIGLFVTGPAAIGSDPCVADTLKLAARQREAAREDASQGQQALLAGDLRVAQELFTTALAKDAANTEAQQGLSQIAKLHAPDSPPVFDWDTFYADRIEPAYRLLGAFAVALVVFFTVSSLTARSMVRVHAQAWPRAPRRCAQWLSLVLITGLTAIFPIYPMFKPFTEQDVVPGVCVAAILGVMALFALVWWWAHQAAVEQGEADAARRSPPGDPKWARSRFRADWWPPPAAIGIVFAIGAVLWFTGLSAPYPRLLLAYGVLIAFGVIITATAFGQNCRVQVAAAAKDGSQDAAAKDYLLGRLQTLGTEQTHGLNASAGGTQLSSLQSQDLSGLPSGSLISTIARIMFALRPDLTWRAQVTVVDPNRVAMSLARNGRLAFTGVFSRSDMGLAPPPSDATAAAAAADVARAQLLTGAAAFILVQLSSVHPELREALCGATQWQSVALQVIGSSVSLSKGEDPAALLRTATNLDPGNATAHFRYLRVLDDQLKTAPYDAAVLAMYQDAKGKVPVDDHAMPKPGWESLYLEILYYASAAALDRCVKLRARGEDIAQCVDNARDDFIRPLQTVCAALSQDWTAGPEVGSAVTAQSLAPLAANFERIANTLRSDATDVYADIGDASFASPMSAYNDACLKALALPIPWLSTATKEQATDAALRDLAFALSTDDSKKSAQTDDYLVSLRDDQDFIGLAGAPPKPKPRLPDVKKLLPHFLTGGRAK
jgi:hypothetical protein